MTPAPALSYHNMIMNVWECEKYFQASDIIMPHHALSHDEVLKRVCGVCLRKHCKGLKNISENYLNLIIKYHHKNYDVKNGNFATVICPSCQRALRDAKSSDGDKKNSKLPMNRYSSMKVPRVSRSSTSCQCSWCFIWRLNGEGAAYKEYCDEVRDKAGRPLQDEPAPDPEVKTICQDCQGERKRGVPHVCNVTSLENNTLKVIIKFIIIIETYSCLCWLFVYPIPIY